VETNKQGNGPKSQWILPNQFLLLKNKKYESSAAMGQQSYWPLANESGGKRARKCSFYLDERVWSHHSALGTSIFDLFSFFFINFFNFFFLKLLFVERGLLALEQECPSCRNVHPTKGVWCLLMDRAVFFYLKTEYLEFKTEKSDWKIKFGLFLTWP